MPEDLDVYSRQGFGHRLGPGRRLGLLIIDFVNGFNDARAFGGGNISAAIDRTVTLLAACRAARLPIVHTRVVFEADGSDRNVFALKVPSLSALTETAPGSQIVPKLTPQPGEFVLRKRLPSAPFWHQSRRLVYLCGGRYGADCRLHDQRLCACQRH